MTRATTRLLVGRRIVGFELRAFPDENVEGKKLRDAYDPVLVLDNGARVTFHVQELDQGDGYGVEPLYHPKHSQIVK